MATRYQVPEGAVFPVSTTGTEDDKLGWAAAVSSALWQTGWDADALRNAPEEPENPDVPEETSSSENPEEPETPETLKFNNAKEIFDYYKTCFTNDDGSSYFGANWFFSGEYPVAFVPSQNKMTGGGFLQSVDFDEYAFWVPAPETGLLEKLWPDLTPETVLPPDASTTSSEETPEETPEPAVLNYGALIGGYDILANPSDGRDITNAEDIDERREVLIVGYEIGGEHSSEFGLAAPVQSSRCFPANNVGNPRYVSGFYVIDPYEPIATEGDTAQEENSGASPFWVFAKYYPDLHAFRIKPETARDSWNGKECYLTDFFFLLKNPNGKGFEEDATTGEGSQGTT